MPPYLQPSHDDRVRIFKATSLRHDRLLGGWSGPRRAVQLDLEAL